MLGVTKTQSWQRLSENIMTYVQFFLESDRLIQVQANIIYFFSFSVSAITRMRAFIPEERYWKFKQFMYIGSSSNFEHF